jgi:hypothetical protein
MKRWARENHPSRRNHACRCRRGTRRPPQVNR